MKIAWGPILNVCCLALLVVIVVLSYQSRIKAEEEKEKLINTIQLVMELRQSSDDLTRFVRTFTVTGNASYWDYFNQVIAIRDGKAPLPVDPYRIYWDLYVLGGPPRALTAPASLASRMEAAGFTEEELSLVTLAKSRSDALIDLETVAHHAMVGLYRPTDPHVAVNTTGMAPDKLLQFSSSAPPDQDYAMGLVHGLDYHREKAGIMDPLDQFFVLSKARAGTMDGARTSSLWLTVLGFCVVAILAGVLAHTTHTYCRSLSKFEELRQRQLVAEETADAISRFNLSDVEYLNQLENPDELQRGFITIANNLKLYKPYLPAHIISNVDGDDDDNDTISTSAGRTARTTDSCLSRSASQMVDLKGRLAVGLEWQQVAMVCLTIVPPKAKAAATSFTGDLTAMFCDLSDAISTVANATGGCVSMSAAGVYFVSYKHHSRGKHALEFINYLKRPTGDYTVAMGVSSGRDLCGNVGGSHHRGYVHVGTVVRQAEGLANVARLMNVNNIVDHASLHNFPDVVGVLRAMVRVCSQHNSTRHRKVPVYHVVEFMIVGTNEWMYELQNLQEMHPTITVNRLIADYLSHDQLGVGCPASDLLEKIPDNVTTSDGVYDLSFLRELPKASYMLFPEGSLRLQPATVAAVETDVDGLPATNSS